RPASRPARGRRAPAVTGNPGRRLSSELTPQSRSGLPVPRRDRDVGIFSQSLTRRGAHEGRAPSGPGRPGLISARPAPAVVLLSCGPELSGATLAPDETT